MKAISTINDAVGGVEVTVLEDLTRKDKSLVKDAKVHLTGKTAFWYVQYRDTTVFGSADLRLARQKQYLNGFVAAAKKAAKDLFMSVPYYKEGFLHRLALTEDGQGILYGAFWACADQCLAGMLVLLYGRDFGRDACGKPGECKKGRAGRYCLCRSCKKPRGVGRVRTDGIGKYDLEKAAGR